jgi:Glycine zipper 2TM domain
MRNLMLALGAATLVIPATMAVPTAKAEARDNHNRHQAREWRGRDGRTYCRRSNGTTGLIVGGVAGGLLGRGLDNGGATGTILGAAGGALAGRAIDRGGSRRCR